MMTNEHLLNIYYVWETGNYTSSIIHFFKVWMVNKITHVTVKST